MREDLTIEHLVILSKLYSGGQFEIGIVDTAIYLGRQTTRRASRCSMTLVLGTANLL